MFSSTCAVVAEVSSGGLLSTTMPLAGRGDVARLVNAVKLVAAVAQPIDARAMVVSALTVMDLARPCRGGFQAGLVGNGHAVLHQIGRTSFAAAHAHAFGLQWFAIGAELLLKILKSEQVMA
jgi:hypothetical protein